MSKANNPRKSPPARRRRAATAGDYVGLPRSPYRYECEHEDRFQPKSTRDLNVVSRIFWAAHRNRVELAPPAVTALLFGTAEAIYKAEAPVIGVVSGAALAGLTWWAAPTKWDRDEEVLFARAVATVASVWLLIACIVGPVNPVAFWSLLVCASVCAVPWYRHKLVRPKSNEELLHEWAERWFGIRVRLGLDGSEVVEATGDQNYAEVIIQLVPGVQTFADVEPLAERIAGALGEPAKSIAVRDMRKTNASRVKLIYRKVSSIDHVIRWEDIVPQAPRKATAPAILGRTENGDWKKVGLLGHWMIVGTTRAGKSMFLHNLMAQITGMYDEESDEPAESLVFFIDLKGGSVAARWKDCIDWPATTLEETVTLLESVMGMIDARGANAPVGEGDGDQLVPCPERPAIFVVFDECAEGLGVSPGAPNQGLKTRATVAAESIARRGAAVNIYLVLSGQDGSLETFGTERLRGNLLKRCGFRVAKSNNAQYVLDTYTRLNVTELEDGQFYYHERTDDPVPIRGPFMTPEGSRTLPQEISRRNAARRPTLDEATAQGGGAAYATRDERRPVKFRAVGTTSSAAAPAVPAPRKDTEMTTNHAPGSAAARAAAIEAEAGLGSGQPVTAEDIRRAQEVPGFDPAQDIRDMLDTFCVLLAGAPAAGVKAQSLMETVGVGKTWMYDRLNVLSEEGLVEQVARGFWRAGPGKRARDLRECIEAWEAERRALVPA